MQTAGGQGGCFARHQKLSGLSSRALPMIPRAVAKMYTDASSEKGREATSADGFPQGVRFPKASDGGMGWKELAQPGSGHVGCGANG